MDPNARKVLIADDEPDILEILKYNLSREGYEVVTAQNGDEALEKAIHSIKRKGFKLETHEVTLHGQCQNCH